MTEPEAIEWGNKAEKKTGLICFVLIAALMFMLAFAVD